MHEAGTELLLYFYFIWFQLENSYIEEKFRVGAAKDKCF